MRCLTLIAVPLVIVSLACGCSKKSESQLPVHPVSGQVLFNGKPAPGALVVFHPKQEGLPTPSGAVDKQGNYTLTTYSASDGAPSGEYDVTVTWTPMIEKNGEFQPGPNKLPARVANKTTSKITARIAEGPNAVPITITR